MAPAALPVIGIIGTVIGAASTVYSGIQGQKASRSQAAAAREAAAQAKEAADIREANFRRKAASYSSELKAEYGASGAVSGEGSPLLNMYVTSRRLEEDAMNIRKEGQWKTQALEDEAALDEMYGNKYMTSGLFGAGKTLLTGGADFIKTLL